MRWFLLLILALPGCVGQISTANIRDMTNPVLDRHDAYVDADTKLLSTVKAVMKLKSSIVRQQLEKNEVSVKNFEPPMIAVADKHDDYVNKDARLTPTLKRIFLRSTTVIRDVIKEAKNE